MSSSTGTAGVLINKYVNSLQALKFHFLGFLFHDVLTMTAAHCLANDRLTGPYSLHQCTSSLALLSRRYVLAYMVEHCHRHQTSTIAGSSGEHLTHMLKERGVSSS